MWKPTGRSHCWGARERDPLSGRLPDVLCPLWDKSVYPRGQEQQSLGAHGTGANPLQSVRGNCRRWAGTLVKSSSPRPETKRLPKPKPMLDQSGPANPALGPASRLTGHRDTARRRSRQAGSPANSPGLGTRYGQRASLHTQQPPRPQRTPVPPSTLTFWGCFGHAVSDGSIPRAAGSVVPTLRTTLKQLCRLLFPDLCF